MKITQEDLAYLRQAAARYGYTPENAADLQRVINYESSGRPDVWGGKGGKYYGLLQFGGPERAKYGVDTVHPSAQNQIDAAFRFLGDRGFKPGMGLLDLYSTINAGSPGHYNASDRPGMTVAKHVAAMSGQPTPETAIPGSAPVLQASFQPSGMVPPSQFAAASDEPVIDEAQYSAPAARGLLAKLTPEAEQQTPIETPQVAGAAPVARGRGLAFRQLTVKTPSFRKRV